MAAGFGFGFGLPSVRTCGEYLAIVTLAFGELVPSVILHLPDWTGGPRGMTGVPAVRLGPWAPDSPLHAYGLALTLAALACLVATRLSASRIGPAAAAAIGLNPARLKLLAFAIGAAYAGQAGAIFAALFGHIEPEQFDLTLSLMALAAVVIGGQWGIPGVVLGALTVAVYDRLLVEALNGALHALGAVINAPMLLSTDLRGDNFAVFGLGLYVATLLRAERNRG